MELEELRERRKKVKQNVENRLGNLDKIANESLRVASIAKNTENILDDLDTQFSKQTGLNKVDISFLLVATALQVAKWILMDTIGDKIDKSTRLDEKSGDKIVKEKIKDYDKNHSGWETERSQTGYKTWKEIIYSSVPYDATKGAPALGVQMEGMYHRYKTLGHDPILGWVFGTANIITDTITLTDLRTYKVEKMHFSHQITMTNMFMQMLESIKEDKNRLPAAIFKQAMHLQSDKYTKLGLPIPVIGVFSEEIAGKLYKSQYDNLCLTRDLKTIGKSASYSILINMLISLLHGIFYDPSKYSSRDIYEVKTRKIISYSNAIASGSNVIYTAVRSYLGDANALNKLDIGGIIVTIYQIVTNEKFIREVKEEFIYGGFDKLIQGEEYDF